MGHSQGFLRFWSNEVIGVLAKLAGKGLSLLIAEQNVNFLKLASRVYILNGGRTGFEGTVAELEAEQSLRREFFGLK